MSEKVKRVSALILVVLFAIATFGGTGLVIWQMTQDNNQQTAAEEEPPVNENALQGKPLEGYEPVEKVTKLTMTDLTEGDGKAAKVGDNITVHYTGALAKTGIVFQSSKDIGQPAPLELKEGSVIQGWVDGVPGMKVGGIRRIVFPAELGYGAEETQGIPANSPLVFDIELVSIQ